MYGGLVLRNIVMYGISLVSLIFAALLVIKICGFAAISWWVVFSPYIVVLGVSGFIFLGCIVLALFVTIWEHYFPPKPGKR